MNLPGEPDEQKKTPKKHLLEKYQNIILTHRRKATM